MATKLVTKEGDSLTTIAEEVYGDGSRWREIYNANKKAIGDDPDLIQPGITLTIPDGDGEAAGKTYVTKAGDTMWDIAQRFYGDGSRWPEIYKANKKTIGNEPDSLKPGLTLTIPA